MRSSRRKSTWIGVAGACALAIAAIAGVARATPATGTVTPVVIAAGSMPTGMGLTARPGTNTIVAEFTFGPNSSTGWHSHPGKTLVTVASGTFTVYHDNCRAHTYGPGDAFVELPSSVHVGRNETSGTVVLGVVFFGVPIGGSPRIRQPQPAGCDVA